MAGSVLLSVSTMKPPADVRESMRVLPAFLQIPLTLLTGKPYQGQRPIWMTPNLHLTAAFTSLAIGVVLSGVALSRGRWWLALLLVGWAVTLHGMRNLRMMIYHQCAHRNMWRSRRAERVLGHIIAGLLIVQDLDRYGIEHVREHHALHHMTLQDPTVQAFLVGLGMRPGMSRRQMWRRLIGKLLSPHFHVSFLVARLHSYVYASDRRRFASAVFAYLIATALITLLEAWAFVLVAWFVPLTVPFQISNTLRLCVKHVFPSPTATKRRGRAYFSSLTFGVFLGEPTPSSRMSSPRRVLAWVLWSMRMLVVHFPARYLVMTGDTVCHDYHHRHPMSRSWGNYLFARQADVEHGHPGWPPYQEVWGLLPAINAVFDSLSTANVAEYDLAHLPQVSRRHIMATFDD